MFVTISDAPLKLAAERTLPVSYTHLDVYKRQGSESRLQQIVIIIEETITKRLQILQTLFSPPDVYKRQAINWYRN